MATTRTLSCSRTRDSADTVNSAMVPSFTRDSFSPLRIVSSDGTSHQPPMKLSSALTTRSRRALTKKLICWRASLAMNRTRSPRAKSSTTCASWRHQKIWNSTSTSGLSAFPTTCHHQMMEPTTRTAPLPDGEILDVSSKTPIERSNLKSIK